MTPTTLPAAPTGLWRNPAFLRLWVADTVSQFGTAVTTLALPLTAVVALGAGAGEMGLLAAARQVPYLLASLHAGVWVDRLPRRSIMVAADLGRALLLAWVPLAAWLGLLRIEQLYLVGFLVGLLSVFAEIAATSIVPSLVERDQIFEANGRLQMSSSAANVAGPGLGGALVQLVTAPIAIALDAVSFLISGLLVGTIGQASAPRPPERAPVGFWREVREGLVGLLGIRVIRDMTISSAIGNVALQVQGAVLYLYLVRELELDAALIGTIFALRSLAGLVGAAAAGGFARRFGPGPAIVFGTLLLEVGLFAIALAAGPRPLVVATLVGAHLLLGFGAPIYSVNQIGVRQSLTPDHLLGRVNASRRFIVFGSGPIGALIGGALGEAIGWRPTLFVGGGLALLSFLWVALSPVRRLRATRSD
jgi:MFS family permease